jgi:hypothetical protein
MSDSNNPDAAGNRVVSMRINLTTGTNADQPIYTNYSALELAAGTLFMDFGFLEPRVISAVAAAARQGAKLPEQLNGKLVARLVLRLRFQGRPARRATSPPKTSSSVCRMA